MRSPEYPITDRASAYSPAFHIDLVLLAKSGVHFVAKITRKRLLRGVFKSITDLEAAIYRCRRNDSRSPTPTLRHRTA